MAIDINTLYSLLVLTNNSIKIKDKFTCKSHLNKPNSFSEIVQFISFDQGGDAAISQRSNKTGSGGSPMKKSQKEPELKGTITYDEAKYIFQIAYQLLNRITDLDLLNNPYH